ncbi:unnamed protein product [Prorocentrum cordatum]|uniref:Uncharacterized protein n=1 Tax=Prorocentrum cordatum TaxID=2364126 RepID=A0ABN9WMG2_9DINO|nr:unnamed protein product [Polarella glacialis]
MLQPDRIDRNVVNDFYASIDTNRPGGVEEFVKLQREDYHLLIGITKQSVLLAARGIGFPHNYSRRAAFQARGQTDWITPLHGDDLTGYDFAEQIKMWMRDSGNEAWSLAEVWLPRRNSGVGTAALFAIIAASGLPLPPRLGRGCMGASGGGGGGGVRVGDGLSAAVGAVRARGRRVSFFWSRRRCCASVCRERERDGLSVGRSFRAQA